MGKVVGFFKGLERSKVTLSLHHTKRHAGGHLNPFNPPCDHGKIMFLLLS